LPEVEGDLRDLLGNGALLKKRIADFEKTLKGFELTMKATAS